MPVIKRYEVEAWIRTVATGEFHYKDVMGLRKVLTPETDSKLRGIIHDLCHTLSPCVESIGRNDGRYRPIPEVPKPVNWQEAPSKTCFPMEFPFPDLNKYVFIYPNTVIILTGSKSSGKTGFIYRTVVLNMNKINVILLSNMEGGENQMRDRFDAMGLDIPNPAPFRVYHVTDNFHDMIKEPDTLYAIDYIDVPESGEFYMIAPSITKIAKKLPPGSVAFIGLQKPRNRDIAFGGEPTLKDATLYLAMDSNKLKVVDAKVAVDPRVHPKNMQWSFSYSDAGTRFYDIKRIGGGQSDLIDQLELE